MSDTTEAPWPAGDMPAQLRWPEGATFGYLHFIGPDDKRAVVPVTHGSTTEEGGRPVWHVDLDGDIATVSPSVHYVGAWHSPNPVRFRLVDDI